MRLAYELSYSNAAVFARSPLRFLCVYASSPFAPGPALTAALTALWMRSRSSTLKTHLLHLELAELTLCAPRRLPVPIGSILRLTATITHSQASINQIHSHVTAEVVDVATGLARRANDFHFT